MSEPQVLNLPLQAKTLTKLRMLAVATGRSYGELEGMLADLVDQSLTAELHDVVAGLDGNAYEPPAVRERMTADEPIVPKKSFAEAMKKESGGQPIVPEAPPQPDPIAGHELSADDLPTEVLSLEEQVEKERAQLTEQGREMQVAAAKVNAVTATQNALGEKIAPEEAALFTIPINEPDVGEALIEAPQLVAKPKPAPKQVNTQYGPASVGGKAYGGNPRVSIKNINDEEESGGQYFF